MYSRSQGHWPRQVPIEHSRGVARKPQRSALQGMLLYLMDAIYFYPSMHATADHEVLTLTSHEHYCAVRAAMKEDTDNSHS